MPTSAATTSGLPAGDHRPLGVYLHVPFCARRCGYCDFNTYTPGELAGSVTTATYLQAVSREIALARSVLGTESALADTVFVGGGTPTLLPEQVLGELLRSVTVGFGLAPGAEVTVEANPDTVTRVLVHSLVAAGVTRVSLGMQSADPSVLAVLDRTHDPQNVTSAVSLLHEAGLAVSLDLIYGTPGESPGQWRDSIRAAIGLEPEHISAYALTVEPGTRLGARVGRGELPGPDGDDQALKYEIADELLTGAGYHWYEVSNWARGSAGPTVASQPGAERRNRCRHNEGYWRGSDWWGLGPGAHSHLDGQRWWNLRHPGSYARALAQGRSPAEGGEVLTADQRYDEQVLLGIRLSDGLPVDVLRPGGRDAMAALVTDGLVGADGSRIRLTRRGRLLADLVVRRLLGC